jgi:DNA-binding SARP family transcriptional activator
MGAEAVLTRLSELSTDALTSIRDEASKRPWRWLEPVRSAISEVGPHRLVAGELLEQIGELSDVPVLRKLARTSKDLGRTSLGRTLARRLAPPVLVDDLGRVRIHVGDHTVEGSIVRRKVLSLLCLLLTRPRWTATREEVVDSLWPDLDPQSALNSLNQTVYFLRRVFEPEYKEETSPGYVRQDGETIWLDPELIDARSRRCISLIRSLTGDPDAVTSVALAQEYLGRFALDFAYEEWAGPFRDSLHAAYLRVIESSVRLDVDSGNYTRGVFLAERASEVEPDSEELQLSLVRVYRLAGAHAAAAEQYAHYSKAMRELGVDPVPIADL